MKNNQWCQEAALNQDLKEFIFFLFSEVDGLVDG